MVRSSNACEVAVPDNHEVLVARESEAASRNCKMFAHVLFQCRPWRWLRYRKEVQHEFRDDIRGAEIGRGDVGRNELPFHPILLLVLLPELRS